MGAHMNFEGGSVSHYFVNGTVILHFVTYLLLCTFHVCIESIQLELTLLLGKASALFQRLVLWQSIGSVEVRRGRR